MIASAEKRAVPRGFDRLAASYDRMAALNPGYRKHLSWSARRLRAPARGRLLDLCCGTGLSTAALAAVYPDAEIVALDASPGMLAIAEGKCFGSRVRFVLGDAVAPAEPGPFDAVLMAYGIRNLPEPDRCLAAILSLLAPGGVACFHEYSVVDSARSRLVWNGVAFGIIIPLGGLLSGTTELYRYLRRSVLAFDGVRAFEARLRSAGFVDVHTLPMDGWQRGIVHSFLARRP